MTACVARPNTQSSIDRSHRGPECILVPSLRVVIVPQDGRIVYRNGGRR